MTRSSWMLEVIQYRGVRITFKFGGMPANGKSQQRSCQLGISSQACLPGLTNQVLVSEALSMELGLKPGPTWAVLHKQEKPNDSESPDDIWSIAFCLVSFVFSFRSRSSVCHGCFPRLEFKLNKM